MRQKWELRLFWFGCFNWNAGLHKVHNFLFPTNNISSKVHLIEFSIFKNCREPPSVALCHDALLECLHQFGTDKISVLFIQIVNGLKLSFDTMFAPGTG